MPETKPDLLAQAYKEIIALTGEDTARDGLLKTPARAAKALRYFTQGYTQDAVEILSSALFQESSKDMVLVKNIEFYSLCEHHLVPFFGKVHIAYIPNEQIVGLSKLPRVVDVFARRLQVQERMTQQIKQVLEQVLQPKGLAIVVEGSHLCMMMRGVSKQQATTITSSYSGVLSEGVRQNEFLQLIQ